MAKQYKVGDSVVMKDNFTGRSRYRRFSGRKGRITYVFHTSNTYDVKLSGSETVLDRVSPKMFRPADELATPEQKREALKKSLITRKKEAEATIQGKRIQIADLILRLDYLNSDESITEFNEMEYSAWLIASTVHTYLQNRMIAEGSGAKTLSKEETVQVLSSIVLNVLKTNNK